MSGARGIEPGWCIDRGFYDAHVIAYARVLRSTALWARVMQDTNPQAGPYYREKRRDLETAAAEAEFGVYR